MNDSINGLDPREQCILQLFFEGKSFREIGDIVGMSANGAKGKKEKALRKLKCAWGLTKLPSIKERFKKEYRGKA